MSGTYQYQSGFPLAWGSVYWDCVVRRSGERSGPNIGKKVSGGIAGLDVPAWDTCFYFHDAPVQTNGVDDPAKQRADHAHPAWTTTCATSRRRCQRADRQPAPVRLRLVKNFALPRGMKLQIRIEAINALNYTVLWNPDT